MSNILMFAVMEDNAMEGLKVIHSSEVRWEPHRQFFGVEVAYLVSLTLSVSPALWLICRQEQHQISTLTNTPMTFSTY
jgi:hypothetical protein